ncbi:CDGSH iron-sulfur domain-containing protein [Thiogranum longum]
MTQENSIKVRENGPLLCTGDIEVYDSEGNLLRKADDVALCRCGESRNKPFCDGSHRDAGFENDGIIVGVTSEEIDGEGPLKITVRRNAMLVAQGPLTIVNSDGSCAARRNRAALCRCGHSRNKPFCDGSHQEAGFEG